MVIMEEDIKEEDIEVDTIINIIIMMMDIIITMIKW